MRKIEIPTSRTKLILMFIVSILFAVGGIILAKNPEEFISYRYRNPEIIRIVGIFAVCFFCLVGIYIVPKLFDKKPGLILDENGIIDNSSAVSVGLILWKDIISIRTEKVQSTKFLIIEVDNPEKYVSGSSKFKNFLLKANMKMYGTPLSISSNGLKYNFNNLEELIKMEFEKHKERPNS
jgi:hypothetical protein